MNPKFRGLYLSIGFIGLAMLIYDAIITFPDINEKVVLLITIPDMVFFSWHTKPIHQKLIIAINKEEVGISETDGNSSG